MIHKLVTLSSLLCVIGSADLFADVSTKATFGGGYQSNLFSDSNEIGDRYATIGGTASYYPSSSISFNGAAQYDAYLTYRDLSNLAAATAIILTPTSESSSITLGFRGNMSTRKFGTLFDLYDQVGMAGGVDLGYRASERLRMRLSVSYSSISYVKSDYGSNRNLDLSTEAYTSIGQSYSIALRADISRRVFDQQALTVASEGYTVGRGSEKGIYDYAGALIRFSHQLGRRTGVALSAGGRLLRSTSDLPIPGYTVDNLSPWSDLWKGANFSFGLKHFFPGQIIVQPALSYSDRDYLEVVELSTTTGTVSGTPRHDRLTSLSLSVTKSKSLAGGEIVTPTLEIGFSRNQSSIEKYTYSEFRSAIGLRVAF